MWRYIYKPCKLNLKYVISNNLQPKFTIKTANNVWLTTNTNVLIMSEVIPTWFLQKASFGLQYCRWLCLFVCVSLCVNHLFVRMITRDPFKPGKVPFVLWSDKPWPSWANLFWKSQFTTFWACLHHNSSLIQARITKFGPEVQDTLLIVLVAIDLGL